MLVKRDQWYWLFEQLVYQGLKPNKAWSEVQRQQRLYREVMNALS